MGDDNNNMTVPTSTNPITGKEQCPDGYVFDSDLQACRLKTKADDAVGTPKTHQMQIHLLSLGIIHYSTQHQVIYRRALIIIRRTRIS